jgi:hypothetical protein
MPLNFAILRSDDLLALAVQAVNLKLDTADAAHPRLVRESQGQAAYLVFGLPPQSITEQAYFETAQLPSPTPPSATPPLPTPAPTPSTSDTLPMPGGAASLLSGPSRLVFELPPSVQSIDYTVEALLDWSQLDLVLPAAAQVPPGATSASAVQSPPITEPGTLETALELPYRLLISPNVMPQGGQPNWAHSTVPVVHAGRAELWHTRLASLKRSGSQVVVTEASQDSPVPFRAVWSPDFVGDGPIPLPGTGTVPFRSAMEARDRDQIVILTSGYAGYLVTDASGVTQGYVPTPADASQLFLSALGGWLTSRGAWSYPVTYTYRQFIAAATAAEADEHAVIFPPLETAELDLIEWDHVATQGRDHYVRIVYEGFLYPFGHRASLIKVTERKVLAPLGASGNGSDSPVAFLMQRMYIVVREQEKSYEGEPYTYHGHEMPFASLVRLTTRVTPEIDAPPAQATSFWINVGGQPFQFHVTAQDLSGQLVDFLAPLIFVSDSETDLSSVAAEYAADPAQQRCDVRAKNVTYADPPPDGDTSLKTAALYFTAQITSGPPFVEAPFIPVLQNAEVTIPSLSELIGTQEAVLVELYGPYLQSGLDPNAGVFADIVGQPYAAGFSADRAGGFATPQLAISAVSARKGLVSGAAQQAAEGTFDPGSYFGASNALLFGTIPLSQLIPVDPQTLLASAALNAPTIRTSAKPNRSHPEQLITEITWQPQLQTFNGQPQIPAVITFTAQSALTVTVTVQTNLNGQPSTSEATSTLKNFALQLVDIVELTIDSISFTSKNGAKSVVKLDLAQPSPISFIGPLQFVQTLADILPAGVFGGSGPSIKATSTELEVSYTIGLPPIPCGMFSLQNIAVMAGLDLPYVNGKPAVEFGFASRSRPFLLTVEIFGGGGFVHLIVGADGVQMVEGALEFGANFSLDLGVASGAVHAMAGIYFQLKGTSSDLTGFIDIGGEVSVLGIVSISIDLNLSLSWYQQGSDKEIQGRATLTVSVHVLFFSASVQLSVERSFKAGGSDPDVGQLMSADQWALYAGAFQ